MTLIEKIEYYKQMAKEHNDIVPDEAECSYVIKDVGIEDMKMLAEHYGVEIKPSLVKNQLFLFLKFDHGYVSCFSEPCVVESSIIYKPLPKEQAA